ncbi:unnamed protein product, partial [Citrullus colocynthis]
ETYVAVSAVCICLGNPHAIAEEINDCDENMRSGGRWEIVIITVLQSLELHTTFKSYQKAPFVSRIREPYLAFRTISVK